MRWMPRCAAPAIPAGDPHHAPHWYNAEWEIDCDPLRVVAFPAYAGDSADYVRDETDRLLAMMPQSTRPGVASIGLRPLSQKQPPAAKVRQRLPV